MVLEWIDRYHVSTSGYSKQFCFGSELHKEIVNKLEQPQYDEPIDISSDLSKQEIWKSLESYHMSSHSATGNAVFWTAPPATNNLFYKMKVWNVAQLGYHGQPCPTWPTRGRGQTPGARRRRRAWSTQASYLGVVSWQFACPSCAAGAPSRSSSHPTTGRGDPPRAESGEKRSWGWPAAACFTRTFGLQTCWCVWLGCSGAGLPGRLRRHARRAVARRCTPQGGGAAAFRRAFAAYREVGRRTLTGGSISAAGPSIRGCGRPWGNSRRSPWPATASRRGVVGTSPAGRSSQHTWPDGQRAPSRSRWSRLSLGAAAAPQPCTAPGRLQPRKGCRAPHGRGRESRIESNSRDRSR
jgi:hypothetical protein